MPTGYTACIEDGATFKEFAWGCARQFGALVHLRDEPMEFKEPAEIAEEAFHLEQLQKAQAAYDKLLAMTPEEIAAARDAWVTEQTEHYDNLQRENNELIKKYEAMLVKAMSWEPPTPDHEGLQDFMVKQLQESIKFDRMPWSKYKPNPAISAQEWHADQLKAAGKTVAAYAESHAKAKKRAAKCNDWIRALAESLKGADQ